jgi:hypothetical protein
MRAESSTPTQQTADMVPSMCDFNYHQIWVMGTADSYVTCCTVIPATNEVVRSYIDKSMYEYITVNTYI